MVGADLCVCPGFSPKPPEWNLVSSVRGSRLRGNDEKGRRETSTFN